MSTLFISDLHLSKHHPGMTTLFLQFLDQQARQAEALYILGDFFDVWIGDDDRSDYHQHIIRALKNIADGGTAVYFMAGNRDFLIGQHFCQASGCQLLTDPTVIDLYGHKILLKHGDDLCLNDKAHLLFRRVTRCPFTTKCFLMLPIHWRRWIAEKIRHISKQKDPVTIKQIGDIPPDAIQQVMHQYKVQHFIHGHTHQPSIHYFYRQEQIYSHIVLSDWGKQGNVLICQPNGKTQLCYF